MAGPYWSHWRTRLDDLTPRVSYLYRVEYEAMALVWMERVEDQVRFEREVLKRFGRPVQMGQAHCFTRQEMEQNLNIVGEVRRNLIREVLHRVGPGPGEHINMRLHG
jgi:hypothetical protein